MSDYPYEPPQREYADTLLAFKDFQLASTWAVRVEPDPLGPVNKIVTLMRGQKRVRSVLCPVPASATVRLVRDDGCWTLRNIQAPRGLFWDARGRGEPAPSIDIQPPGWRVEVDGRTVLDVTDAELIPPAPPPPSVQRWKKIRQALRDRLHAEADRIAGRFGYHRDGECGDDW